MVADNLRAYHPAEYHLKFRKTGKGKHVVALRRPRATYAYLQALATTARRQRRRFDNGDYDRVLAARIKALDTKAAQAQTPTSTVPAPAQQSIAQTRDF